MNTVFLQKLHRVLGFSAALFLIVLSVTGVLINHVSLLSLDKHPIPEWISDLVYGFQYDSAEFTLASGAVYQNAIGQIFYSNDDKEEMPLLLGRCERRMVGAETALLDGERALLVACNDQAFMYTIDGELVDQWSESTSLPVPLLWMGLAGELEGQRTDAVLLYNGADVYVFDTESFGIHKTNASVELKTRLTEQVDTNSTTELDLTWERLLADLHSGRALGFVGVVIMDLTALSLLILVVSGYLSWREKQRLIMQFKQNS